MATWWRFRGPRSPSLPGGCLVIRLTPQRVLPTNALAVRGSGGPVARIGALDLHVCATSVGFRLDRDHQSWALHRGLETPDTRDRHRPRPLATGSRSWSSKTMNHITPSGCDGSPPAQGRLVGRSSSTPRGQSVRRTGPCQENRFRSLSFGCGPRRSERCRGVPPQTRRQGAPKPQGHGRPSGRRGGRKRWGARSAAHRTDRHR